VNVGVFRPNVRLLDFFAIGRDHDDSHDCRSRSRQAIIAMWSVNGVNAVVMRPSGHRPHKSFYVDETSGINQVRLAIGNGLVPNTNFWRKIYNYCRKIVWLQCQLNCFPTSPPTISIVRNNNDASTMAWPLSSEAGLPSFMLFHKREDTLYHFLV
jgi:hypothetical protein